jgi:hypothetical protein
LLTRQSRSPAGWATTGCERARPLGDDVLLAASLLLYLQAIGPAQSGQLFGEAIACTERSGDHLTNSWLHNDVGYVALAAGDIPAARAHLDAVAHAGQQIGFENNAVPENLSLVLRAEGDPDRAPVRVRGKPADQPPER